jgi:hypothetical protein
MMLIAVQKTDMAAIRKTSAAPQSLEGIPSRRGPDASVKWLWKEAPVMEAKPFVSLKVFRYGAE